MVYPGMYSPGHLPEGYWATRVPLRLPILDQPPTVNHAGLHQLWPESTICGSVVHRCIPGIMDHSMLNRP